MKKSVEFVIYILYNYYNKGSNASIAFQTALMSLSFLIFINILILFEVSGFDLQKQLPLELLNLNGKLINAIKFLIVWVPILLTLNFIYSEKEIRKKVYPKNKIEKGGFILVMHSIFSFAILMYLAKLING